jgi:hypothetical protein
MKTSAMLWSGGYEHIVDQLTLPDADDRHVLAAAIHGGANIIVTVNLRDFPADMLATHGITALHPDTFIGRILANEPDEVIAALRELHRDLKDPPIPMNELLTGFARIGLPETVTELRWKAERPLWGTVANVTRHGPARWPSFRGTRPTEDPTRRTAR